ncbi:cation-efflux pump FieF [Deltaproteobacteria bacterium]|nr:cation-efflux pump FieF [Deltaproteobacteria bacterium]
MKLHPLTVAILFTLVLGGVKLAIALLSGSRAVLASAADSLSDAVVSGVNLLMVRQAAEPPDEGHPWGHGKAEALASLTQAVLLAAVVGGVVYSAVQGLGATGAPPPATGGALIGMAVSMLGSFLISAFLMRHARLTGSLVLAADAAHYRMDLLAGAAVVLGLVVTRLTGRSEADAVASLIVSVLMAKEVWSLGREAVDELMDRPLPDKEVEALRAGLAGYGDPVRGFHDLRTRRSGPMRFVQVHVSLPPSISFAAAHAEIHRVEDYLKTVLPNVDAMVHADLDGDTEASPGAPPR